MTHPFRLTLTRRFCALPIIALLSFTLVCHALPAVAQELEDAIDAGDLAQVQSILKKNPESVQHADEEGKTPLHHAAQYGRVSIAEALVNAGARLDATDSLGFTPLHEALYARMAASGALPNLDMIAWLIDHGADIDAADEDNRTPIFYAFDSAAARLLLSHKARVDGRTREDGSTPLHIAAGSGALDVVQLLVEAGADINSHNDVGLTPLHQAIYQSDRSDEDSIDLRTIDWLVTHGADVNAIDTGGRTPLHYALHPLLIDYLVAHGAKVDARDSAIATPLHYAARFGVVAAMEHLLDAGADVNARMYEAWTPLHVALTNRIDNEEQERAVSRMTDLLLKHGADVNATDVLGQTPIFHASTPAIVSTLLAHGAKADIRDSAGSTPLHMAVYNGDREIVDALIAAGANVNVRNAQGETPLSIARREKNQKLQQLLKKKGARE
jgi:cytohesin